MPVEFYRYVRELPDWMRVNYHEQAIWQWIEFAILTVMAVGLIFCFVGGKAVGGNQQAWRAARYRA